MLPLLMLLKKSIHVSVEFSLSYCFIRQNIPLKYGKKTVLIRVLQRLPMKLFFNLYSQDAAIKECIYFSNTERMAVILMDF